MFDVTDNACEAIAKMLDDAGVQEGMAARLVVSNDGIGLAPDAPQESDQQFNMGERTVLLVDEQVASMLGDRTLDTQQSEEGTSLVLS